MTKTILKDRDLYYDGKSSYNEEQLIENLLLGIDCSESFTKTKSTGFKSKTKCDILPSKQWTIPQEYLDIDLEFLFIELASPNGSEALERTKYELALYKKHNLDDVLKLMCYVRDTFIKNNIVWGVGRGSSVASYLLFLLEIHLIDSIKYGLDIHDFIRTK